MKDLYFDNTNLQWEGEEATKQGAKSLIVTLEKGREGEMSNIFF